MGTAAVPPAGSLLSLLVFCELSHATIHTEDKLEPSDRKTYRIPFVTEGFFGHQLPSRPYKHTMWQMRRT